MVQMNQIGQYNYPTLVTFRQTYEVTKEALEKYGGFISNLDAAAVLGYQFNNPQGVPGYIYKRYDEMCQFGTLQRAKGGLRTTDLAKEALNPYEPAQAREGMRKAINNFPLIIKAFNEWKGNVPEPDAFAAKITSVAEVDWTEAKKHVDSLRKIIIDCFEFLKLSSGITPVSEQKVELKQTDVSGFQGDVSSAPSVKVTTSLLPYGELKSTAGSVTIRNIATLGIARHILEVLEQEMKADLQREQENKTAKIEIAEHDEGAPS